MNILTVSYTHLYRGADILILDEPTAVLTPQETDRLFSVLKRMRSEGKSVIIITHKLHEVLEISDRVAVLCKGQPVSYTHLDVYKRQPLWSCHLTVPSEICILSAISAIESPPK